MIFDRDYQIEAVASIWSYFATHPTGNPVVAMPTATGKSVVIARFLQSVFNAYPNQRVMMLTHVKELIKQNYNKLLEAWPFAPAGIYSAGLGVKDHRQPITCAGIASVAKKWALFGHIDLVLIDEAHLVSPNDETMYQEFLKGLRSINPFVRVVGFTATPWRMGQGLITDPVIDAQGEERPSLFTDFCFDVTGLEPFNRFIAEGYLLPPVAKRTNTTLSVDGVHMRGGEYIEKELQTAVDKDEITHAALLEALELGANRRKWLVFASGTDHADHIADMLNRMGVPSGCVHSKREGRDQTLADFRAGRLRAVVNNNVLTTGFDDPEIDLIVMLRPTMSTVLWVQMVGRGTRPCFAPGYDLNTAEGRLAAIMASHKRNCLVLDYAANVRRLGPINDPVVPKRKGKGGGSAPIKYCEKCGCDVHASLHFCNTILEDGTICNFEFTFETKLKQSASSEALIKESAPIVKVFEVDHITISKHTKIGSPDMVRVAYYCGYQRFLEHVCVGHTNQAVRFARAWWKARSSDPMPTNADEAIRQMSNLPQATHLRIWVNKKPYPEILASCLDGSAFGEKEVSDSWIPPKVQVLAEQNNKFKFDDDIPF